MGRGTKNGLRSLFFEAAESEDWWLGGSQGYGLGKQSGEERSKTLANIRTGNTDLGLRGAKSAGGQGNPDIPIYGGQFFLPTCQRWLMTSAPSQPRSEGRALKKGQVLRSSERIIMQAIPWSLLGRESGHPNWQGSTTNAVQSYALGEGKQSEATEPKTRHAWPRRSR